MRLLRERNDDQHSLLQDNTHPGAPRVARQGGQRPIVEARKALWQSMTMSWHHSDDDDDDENDVSWPGQ